MAEQLAKRATLEWVEYVLEQFNERALSEKQACQLLEIKRIQLYELRKKHKGSGLHIPYLIDLSFLSP